MKHINVFDVLVVYSDALATSAASKTRELQPFSKPSGRTAYNIAYAHLLKNLNRQGLSCAFSTSDAIVSAGTCNSYWTLDGHTWKKHKALCFAKQIFDKFSPVTTIRRDQREMLFSTPDIEPSNDGYLTTLFFDKLLTYSSLEDFTIPTVDLKSGTKNQIKKSLENLIRQINLDSHKNDFGKEIIVKDRFGAGGNNIYKISKNFVNNIFIITQKNPELRFVLQPFMKFDQGFSFKNKTRASDIRLIFSNGVIFQTYIRMASQGDFRCNEHQGGFSLYVKLSDIPQKILEASAKIVSLINRESSLYALDFIVGNSGRVYLLEGNIGPGIYWDEGSKIEEKMSKQLIAKIVSEFVRRLQPEIDENANSLLPISGNLLVSFDAIATA